jgi:hypothetical protein
MRGFVAPVIPDSAMLHLGYPLARSSRSGMTAASPAFLAQRKPSRNRRAAAHRVTGHEASQRGGPGFDHDHASPLAIGNGPDGAFEIDAGNAWRTLQAFFHVFARF